MPRLLRHLLRTRALILLLLIAPVALSLMPSAQAAESSKIITRNFCVFDPVGANGPLFAIVKTFVPVALEAGVKLELHAYTDEQVAAADFKQGQCDGVLLTGTRARQFNKFTGSLEALGAIPNKKAMEILFNTLTQAKAAPLMTNGDYEVAGVFPAGAVYLYTRDRSIDSVEELQGKKIATLDYDKASLTMVRYVGASVVGANAATFASLFNNGSVDICYAPAVAYQPLELYKGLGKNGGIFKYAVAYMNFQVILHRHRFPPNAAQMVRDESRKKIDEAYKIIADAEKGIPKKDWMYPTPSQVEQYNALLSKVRQKLLAEGVYDARALKLMRAVRCKVDPTRAECALAMQ